MRTLPRWWQSDFGLFNHLHKACSLVDQLIISIVITLLVSEINFENQLRV